MTSHAVVVERSLVPALNISDIRDNLIWNKNDTITVLYRIEAYHEPSMDDEQFNQAAMLAENIWSSLPEGTTYQFYVDVDYNRGVSQLEQMFPAIIGDDPTSTLFEEIRQSRLRELQRIDPSVPGMNMVQERRHYLAATFRPAAFLRSTGRELLDNVKRALGWHTNKYEGTYQAAKDAASGFDKACTTRFMQMGLGIHRCTDAEIISFIYSILNPTAGKSIDCQALSRQARIQRDYLPASILGELPYLVDETPIGSLVNDDLVVRRTHLEVGDQYVTVVSMKELPDRTEPGFLVPLLRMGRERYVVVYRVDIPARTEEIADMRVRGRMASGLRFNDFLVKTDRSDPMARLVEKQSDFALEQMIGSTQRIFGASIQVLLYEKSSQDLDEATQECLSTMSRAFGIHGVRETYALKPAYLSLLPGSPIYYDRRKKTLSGNMVDMLPWYDHRCLPGKIPFISNANSLVLYDPFDTTAQTNANILISGPAGSGKSVLAQILLSGYELATRALGEPEPYVFILDNGQSYRRYMELRPDARYIRFDFDRPPGIDIFQWVPTGGPSDGDELDEHVSRLQALLADLVLKGGDNDEIAERKKNGIEEALYTMYRGGRAQEFVSLRTIVLEMASAAPDPTSQAFYHALAGDLYSYVEGKYARLFRPNPELALHKGIRAVCYDFQGLADHPDLAAMSLRLVIYEIRRFATRVRALGHRTFIPIDESWALLDPASGGAHIAARGGSFIASSIRMGRKEGWSVIGLSQTIDDFASSAYGAAIVGNSATKFIGRPGPDGIAGLKRHLNLTDRQVEQLRNLRHTTRFHEFLLIQGDITHVVRVPLDPMSRWIFTTSPKDKDRLRDMEERFPDLTLLERIHRLMQEPERESVVRIPHALPRTEQPSSRLPRPAARHAGVALPDTTDDLASDVVEGILDGALHAVVDDAFTANDDAD